MINQRPCLLPHGRPTLTEPCRRGWGPAWVLVRRVTPVVVHFRVFWAVRPGHWLYSGRVAGSAGQVHVPHEAVPLGVLRAVAVVGRPRRDIPAATHLVVRAEPAARAQRE